jgi:serine/threonine protein kinase
MTGFICLFCIHSFLKKSLLIVSIAIFLKILDFDSALVQSGNFASEYVCARYVNNPVLLSQLYNISITRWWRAPEVFVNWERYDDKLDIWSVGCIMAELILLRPLFRGNDLVDQLIKIFDIIGTPDLDTLNAVCTPGL